MKPCNVVLHSVMRRDGYDKAALRLAIVRYRLRGEDVETCIKLRKGADEADSILH